MLSSDVEKLRNIQPELVAVGDKISGCFYLSASISNKSKGRGAVVVTHPWNFDPENDPKHIREHFYVDIQLDEDCFPTVYEISGKILNWKSKIPVEYWHVNADDSLCLGSKREISHEKDTAESFADFLNKVLTHYFFYMAYVEKFGNEPWEAHRHSLLAALELSSDGVLENIDWVTRFMNIDEWKALLEKTKGVELKLKDQCPFCVRTSEVRYCRSHRKLVKGYNNLVLYFKSDAS